MVANDINKFEPLSNGNNDFFQKFSPRNRVIIPDIPLTKMDNSKENSLIQLDRRFADIKRKKLHTNSSFKSKGQKNGDLLSQRNMSLPPETSDRMTMSSNAISLNPLKNQRNVKGAQLAQPTDSTKVSDSPKIDVRQMISDTQIISSMESSPLSSKNHNTRNIQIPESFKSTLKIDVSFLKRTLSPSNGESFEMSSSPIKAPSTPRLRKQVAFSSDVESEPYSSSPLKGLSRKSILKVTDESTLDKVMPLEEILKQDLTQNESWQLGLVLQIPANYPGLKSVLVTLGKALDNIKFHRLYEVYATLNHLIKSNPKMLLSDSYFSEDILKSFIAAVKRNLFQIVQNLQTSDAFKLRTTSQGLKLLTSLSTLTAPMSNTMSVVYDLVIKLMINEYISKGLTISILQFIKVLPETLYDKIENISIALIQMKYFTSASISSEKLNILKRFVVLRPALISKCGYQLFSFVLYSIINTDVPAYGKILNSATSILTFSARNSESKNALYRVLSETLEDSYNSLRSNTETCLTSSMTISQAICETLNYLIHLELYAQAAKTWSYLMFMVCYDRKDFLLEEWENYQYFLTVFQKLYVNQGGTAFAIEAWKSVIYNFQILNSITWDTEKLKQILDSILLPFKNIQISSNNELVKQWTNHQGYVTLYCRLVYSIRLHLEVTDNEEQKALLLEAMLFPLISLKICDDITNHIFKNIFGSIKSIVKETADWCFWQSDFDKWQGRIFPISKSMFKSKRIFKSLLQFAWDSRYTELIIPTIDCIYDILDNLKLLLSDKENLEATLLVADFLDQLVEENDEKNINTLDYFKLIGGASENILLYKKSPEECYFLVKVYNRLSNICNLDHVHNICKEKIGSTKTAIMILLSNTKTQEIFLDFDYDSCPNNMLVGEEFQFTCSDEKKIIENFESILISSNDFKNTYAKAICFLNKTGLLLCLKPISRLNLFQRILSLPVTQSNIQHFYDITSTSLLESVLSIFTCSDDTASNGQKLANLLLHLTDYESMPCTWLTLIGSKLTHILHKGVKLESSLLKFIFYVLQQQSEEVSNHFKETAHRRHLYDITILEKDEKLNSLLFQEDKTPNEINNVGESSLEFNQKIDDANERLLINQKSPEDSNENNDSVAVDDMKSFIIDSIKEEHSVSSDDSSGLHSLTDMNEINKASAKRTRSEHHYSGNINLDDRETTKRRKKNERRRRRRKERKEREKREFEDRQTSDSELGSKAWEVSQNGSINLPNNESMESELPNTDLLQLRSLLKKLNATTIELNGETKEDLERDLVIMLAKLKHANI